MNYHALVKKARFKMQNVKELLDEVFNSGKYSYATIFTYGNLQHRCAVGTTIYEPRDGYCLLSKTIEETVSPFEENKSPRTAIETIFIDYSKIIEVQTIEKL
jgi:hypothetical protein